MSTNNIPELIKEYGGQITFMGGIDSGKVDKPDWTRENIAKVVEEACQANGTKYYIPCNTMGGPESIYPGVYETISEGRDRQSQRQDLQVNNRGFLQKSKGVSGIVR